MIFGLPLLGGAALLGTAAFGIAKLTGASNKKAIMAGLGVFGGSAALGALTAPAVQAKTTALGAAAGSGSTSAAANAAALKASMSGGTSQILGPGGSFTPFGGALGSQGTLVGPTLSGAPLSTPVGISPGFSGATGPSLLNAPPIASGQYVPGVVDATGAAKSIVRPDLVTEPQSVVDKVTSFVGKNPGTTLGGVAALGSLAMSPKTSQIYDDSTAPVPFNEQEYTDAYNRQRAAMQRLSERAPAPTMTADALTPANVYERTEEMFAAKQGGLATLKLKEGGVNYLPSKSDHDEKDANNYVRAMGYVEDGSGNGDKDEDTMLAQLADGEFVSRADAILGAGIMSGANPDDFKDMRRKGAQFFYKQQDSLKRVYDLVSDGNKAS